MRRKFLASILAFCMVLTLFPMTAFAANTAPGQDLTVTVAALGTAEKGKVTLKVAAKEGGSIPSDAEIRYKVIDAATDEEIPDTESFSSWGTKYELDADGDVMTLENITDGKFIAAAYVDNTSSSVKSGVSTEVNDNYNAVTKIEMAKTLTLTMGSTASQKLEPTLTLQDSENEASGTVTWTSSATGVATVDAEGTVTAVAAGTANITATIDEQTATCAVTVNAATPPEPTTYNITIPQTIAGGSVVAKVDDNAATSAEEGDTVTLAVTPSSGKQIKTLTVKDSTNTAVTVTPTVAAGTNSYIFTMPASNVTVAAEFEDITYTVTVGTIVGGGGTVTADKTSAAKDATVTLTVEPNAGYKLKTLSLNAGTLSPAFSDTDPKDSYTFAMPEENVTVTATFVAIPYGITVNAGDGTVAITGTSVTGDDGSKTATVGNEITVVITAPSNKAVKSVTSTDATVKIGSTVKDSETWKTTCTFTMPAKAVSLTVDYEDAGSNSISVVNGSGGTVKADKITANAEANVTLTVTADAGYKLTSLVVKDADSDDVTLTPEFDSANVAGSYSFTMIAKNITVTPTFTPIDYTVTASPSENGTVTPSKTSAAHVGDTITLTIDPDDGYKLGTLTVTGDGAVATTKNSETEYQFTMPASNVTITATFVEEGSDTPDPGPNPGGGGGGGGGTTTPTDPTDPTPPPSTGEDVTQTVTPDVSDGTASATVDKETADKIVSDAVDNKSENVTVKVDVPAGSDVNEVKADIPASAVADLASKTDAALTVDTPVANVTIPNETLSQLGGASGNVTVTAAVNEDNSVKVEVQANGSTVGSLNGGMKVDLPVSQPTAGTVAVLVDENGNETILPKSSLDGSEMAVLLETGSATIKFVDNAQNFADTDSHWAKNSIAFVSSRNLFQGMENNNFKADVPMNRAMLVTVLHRLESTPAAAGSSFDDVPSDSYYATAAAWAAGKGIVTGDASGFSGDRSVTREEMAVMLYRYVQTINGNKGTLGSFSGMGGASDVSSWANQAMRWAVGSGIISGDNSGNLNPGSTATRGEVSQMLMNFVKLITK